MSQDDLDLGSESGGPGVTKPSPYFPTSEGGEAVPSEEVLESEPAEELIGV